MHACVAVTPFLRISKPIVSMYDWFYFDLQVSLLRVIKLNAREWWIIIIGLLGAAVNGSIWPLFALLFGEILEVFARPADEILDGIHLWAGLFIILGIVSGVGVFLKVCMHM